MQVFPLIDRAMLAQEAREAYNSRTPRVWPSEASAELFDTREAGIAGGCHRKSYFRMTGEPPSNQIGMCAARRFRTGRAMELDIVNLAKAAGIFVAAGVRYHVADIDLPLELDLVVRDPQTARMYVIENKTTYGYAANKKVIKDGHPRIEGVVQSSIYLNEFSTGEILKEIIHESCRRKQVARDDMQVWDHDQESWQFQKAKKEIERNRIEVDFDAMALCSDELDPAAVLNAWETLRIEQFRTRNLKFNATWEMDRAYQFQFRGGRDSTSEYECALCFYLRQDGWNPQQIMDAITVWRREHDLPAPTYHSRYRATIGKAVAMVTVNPMEVKESKPGEPKAGLLDALPGAPKRPMAVVEEVGLEAAAVRMALTRRVRAGKALHVGQECLAVPVAAIEETTEPASVSAYDPYDDPSGPAALKVTAYDPYDDPFAGPNNWTWQPDNLDDFAAEEAAEPVRIRIGGVMRPRSSDSSTGRCGR